MRLCIQAHGHACRQPASSCGESRALYEGFRCVGQRQDAGHRSHAHDVWPAILTQVQPPAGVSSGVWGMRGM